MASRTKRTIPARAKKTSSKKSLQKSVSKSKRKNIPFIHGFFGRNQKEKEPVKSTAPPRKTIPTSKAPVHWNIRVARYNPSMDFTPRTHEYSVPPHEGESILDLLTRIKHTQDGSLTFRASCGYGGCGTCGVRVNGKPLLGCVTQVKDHLDANRSLRIDPLDAETTLKDLVVDEKPFFAQLTEVKPWRVPRPNDAKRNHKMGVNDVAALGNSQQCILCGLCNANANASVKPELGPAAFVKGFRYANDIRDGDAARPTALATHLPVHYSLEKANWCPRDIFPGDKIREIREKADKSKDPPSGTKAKR